MICSLLFDLLLGILFSTLIYFVSYKIFTKYLIELTNWSDWLKVTIEWMMGFPYGFKPNKELDSFLGGCMISLLDGWKAMIWNLILYYGEMLMKVILMIGIMFGFTIQISLFHDIFLYLTAHLHFIYIFFSNIYRFFSKLLLTLFKMFKGAKFNIWTNRNEVENFSVDELMLGIFIFLITMFLIPTIIMYYICVVVIILVVVCC